jgi:cytoskeletal protein CcmA (bactofilin family)
MGGIQMFSTTKKGKQGSNISGDMDTIIGVSSCIEGNINSNGAIRIDGKFIGNVNTKTDLILGEQGYIKGSIVANNASISGKIEGNIKCLGLLQIMTTGRVFGDIEVINIAISEGALFKGSCTMINKPEEIEDIKLIESSMEDEEMMFTEKKIQE